MTEELRQQVQQALNEQGLTRADLARAMGVHQNTVTRALNDANNGGKVPGVWAAMLEVLGLELTVKKKSEQ